MKAKPTGAEHYRLRSKQVRAIAKDIFDPEERETLQEIAKEYEEMARKVEAK